jgi:hypothetical protein
LIKRLPQLSTGDEQVLQAIVHLEDDPYFQVLKDWLTNDCPGFILERFKARAGNTEQDIMDKGALQALDDIRETFNQAITWLGNIKLRKKEGAQNV